MARTRVLLADMPRILADIIRSSLAPHSDIEIVGEVTTTSALLEATTVESPDVVVVGLGETEQPAALDDVFQRAPRVRILGVAGERRQAYLYELRPHRVVLGELSLEDLVEVIRTAGTTARFAQRTPTFGSLP